jgi:hypothetical protein
MQQLFQQGISPRKAAQPDFQAENDNLFSELLHNRQCKSGSHSLTDGSHMHSIPLEREG